MHLPGVEQPVSARRKIPRKRGVNERSVVIV
jgi:hypothetical protein